MARRGEPELLGARFGERMGADARGGFLTKGRRVGAKGGAFCVPPPFAGIPRNPQSSETA